MIQSDVSKWKNVPLPRDNRFNTYFHTLMHDLRTPLTQITGFAELLNLDESLAVGQREYAAAIVFACGELHHAVLAHLKLIESTLGGEDRPDQAAQGTSRDNQPEPLHANGDGSKSSGRNW
jgi:signal transduction histidine kinase